MATESYVVARDGLYVRCARAMEGALVADCMTANLPEAMSLSPVGAADLAAAIGNGAIAVPYEVAALLSLPYAERARALTDLMHPADDPLPSPLDPGPEAVIACGTCAHEPGPVDAPPCCTCWRYSEWEAGL